MKLDWTERAPGGALVAHGEAWTYLIAHNDRNAVLTRYGTSYSGPGRAGREQDAARVAREAALYAIQLGGAWDTVPEAVAGVVVHLQESAQAYESGLDVTGQPAWWHGHAQGSRP
jgi:hypothetical protein